MVDFIPNQWNSNSNGLQNRYTSQTILTEKNTHKSLNNHQRTSLQSQCGPGEYTHPACGIPTGLVPQFNEQPAAWLFSQF